MSADGISTREARGHYDLIVAATREKVLHQKPNAPAAWKYFDILTKLRAELRR